MDETIFLITFDFTSRYCRSHLCIARFFLISYLTVNEFYIFVDNIILHYACTTTFQRRSRSFALFITEYSTEEFGTRMKRKSMIYVNRILDKSSCLKRAWVNYGLAIFPHTNSIIF